MDNMATNFEYDAKHDALHLYFDICDNCNVESIDGMIVWRKNNNDKQWVHAIILDFSIFSFQTLDRVKINFECRNNIRRLQTVLRHNMRKDWDVTNARSCLYFKKPLDETMARSIIDSIILNYE
jgi:hypothetical protein